VVKKVALSLAQVALVAALSLAQVALVAVLLLAQVAHWPPSPRPAAIYWLASAFQRLHLWQIAG
jgi:hypothetical protein